MLSQIHKERLKKNWGEKAEALDCYAEVKFSLVEMFWHCYILAVNPEDEDTMLCITQRPGEVAVEEWSLKELFSLYDLKGEPPTFDEEYRRMRASVLFKRLGEGK